MKPSTITPSEIKFFRKVENVAENDFLTSSASVDDLIPGTIVYYVSALGKDSYIRKYCLTSTPKTMGTTKYLSVTYFSEFSDDLSFSLEDCNVVPNIYNDHALFLSNEIANDYLRKCLKAPNERHASLMCDVLDTHSINWHTK